MDEAGSAPAEQVERAGCAYPDCFGERGMHLGHASLGGPPGDRAPLAAGLFGAIDGARCQPPAAGSVSG